MMRSPGIDHERMERAEKLIHEFSMMKRWLPGDTVYPLYDNSNGEKFFLDSTDIEMLIDGLDTVYEDSRRRVDKMGKWCEVQVHINLKDLDKKAGKRRKKKAKDGK